MGKYLVKQINSGGYMKRYALKLADGLLSVALVFVALFVSWKILELLAGPY